MSIYAPVETCKGCGAPRHGSVNVGQICLERRIAVLESDVARLRQWIATELAIPVLAVP